MAACYGLSISSSEVGKPFLNLTFSWLGLFHVLWCSVILSPSPDSKIGHKLYFFISQGTETSFIYKCRNGKHIMTMDINLLEPKDRITFKPTTECRFRKQKAIRTQFHLLSLLCTVPLCPYPLCRPVFFTLLSTCLNTATLQIPDTCWSCL